MPNKNFEIPITDDPNLGPQHTFTGKQLTSWWTSHYNRYRLKEHEYRISGDVSKHLDFWIFTVPIISLSLITILLTQLNSIEVDTKKVAIACLAAANAAAAAVQKYWDINSEAGALQSTAAQYKELKLRCREVLSKCQLLGEDKMVPNELVRMSLMVYDDIVSSETRFACGPPSHKSQWLVRLCCCHGYRIKPLTKQQLDNEFEGHGQVVHVE